MENEKPGWDRPATEDIESGTDAEESLALGPFVRAVGECAALLAGIKERVDDHLGASPDEIAWGHVADADRLLHHLRQAAYVAGVGEEPTA